MTKIIEVHVVPKSKKNRLEQMPSLFPEEPPVWKAWVQAPPEDGKANQAVCLLVAEQFNVSPSKVSIWKGQTSRKKRVSIDIP